MTDASSPPPEVSEQALILEKLTAIEARLSGLEKAAAVSGDIISTIPATVATVVDTVDAAIDDLSTRGVDVDARMRRMKELMEKATEPDTLETLERGLEIAGTLQQTFAAIADTFDGHASRLAESGVDIDERMKIMLQVVERISAPESLTVVCDLLENVDAIRRLLDSGVFGPGAINVVGRLAHALSQVEIEKTQPVGLLGTLSALGKPETKRALGVLVAIGKSFGKAVDELPPVTIHSRSIPPRTPSNPTPLSDSTSNGSRS